MLHHAIMSAAQHQRQTGVKLTSPISVDQRTLYNGNTISTPCPTVYLYKKSKGKDNAPSSGAVIAPDRSVSTAENQFHNLTAKRLHISTDITERDRSLVTH